MGPFWGRQRLSQARSASGCQIKHTSSPADTLCEVQFESTDLARGHSAHIRSIARQLLPGVVLPGLIYLIASRRAPVLIALAAASSVPLLDLAGRLVRGKQPTWAGMVFIGAGGISVGLAMALHSPIFILVKSAVMSGILGLAFAFSAVIRRPLTRTLALAGQQAALAVTVSPGTVMVVDGPSHAVLTVLGTVWSIMYVRRIQRRHPDLGLF